MLKKPIETVIEFVMVLLVIMKTVMVPVGLYW